MPSIFRKPLRALLPLGFTLALMPAAYADDQPFLTLDATDIEPQSAFELEQNFGWNTGMTNRGYSEFEGESEIEYGLSDTVQLAAATSYAWTREHYHVFGAPAETGSEWGGIEGEAIYQAQNVYFDPIGLGFLVAAGAGPNGRAFEAKVLVQKNYFNSRLRLVANLGGEFGSAKDGSWSDYSALSLNLGAAYNVTWSWSLGMEFNAEHEFDGLLVNGKAVPGATTYYLGPTIQYAAHPWTVSLGAQFQLPWSQDPSHGAGAVAGGYLADAERARIGLRITRDLY